MALLSNQFSRAEDDVLGAVLELPSWDLFMTVSPKVAVEQCSRALSDTMARSSTDVAKILRRRAQAYLRQGRFREAKSDVEQVLRSFPDDREARYLRAGVLSYLGLQDEALSEFRALIKADPNYAAPYSGLAAQFLIKGDLVSGIDFAAKAITLDRTGVVAAHAYLLRGQGYLLQGDHRRGLDDITRSIELTPLGAHNPENAYGLRGKALTFLGRRKEAIACYQMARRLSQAPAKVILELWQSYFSMRRYHVCLQLAQEVLELDRSNSAGVTALAATLNRLGKYKEAQEACNQVVVTDPNYLSARKEMGAVFESMEQYDEALRCYSEVLRHREDHVPTLIAAAYLYATCPVDRIRNGEMARSLALRALKAARVGEPYALMTAAAAHAECGNYDDAIGFLRRALEASLEDVGFQEYLRKQLALYSDRKPYRRQYDREIGDYDGEKK